MDQVYIKKVDGTRVDTENERNERNGVVQRGKGINRPSDHQRGNRPPNIKTPLIIDHQRDLDPFDPSASIID